MTSYNLPYFAEPTAFLAILPTTEDIRSTTETLSKTAGRKVVGIGQHFIVKYGMQVYPLEGKIMLLLQHSIKVPVPRIYAVYQSSDKESTFIVMERIRSLTLVSEWKNMGVQTKQLVSIGLGRTFDEMRNLESPGGYCSIGRCGSPDGLFWTSDPSKPFVGPFDTEEKLNEAMIAKYVEDGLSKHKADFYARAFKEVLKDHPPVFTQGNFQRTNILIRQPSPVLVNGDEIVHEGLEIVLVDWEFVGWYPGYWEYARAAFSCGRWDDDCDFWVDEILQPFRNEYAWVQMLLLEL